MCWATPQKVTPPRVTGITPASGEGEQRALWAPGGSQARSLKAMAKNEARGEDKETNLSQGEARASTRGQQGVNPEQ